MKILSTAVLALSSMPFSHAFMPQAAFRPTETRLNLFAMDSPPAVELTQGKIDGALWLCFRFLSYVFLTVSISFLSSEASQMQEVQSTSRSAISGSSLYLSAGNFDTMDFSMPSYSDATKAGEKKEAPSFGNPFGGFGGSEENPAADEAQVDKAAEKAAAAAAKAEEKAAAEARKADEKEYATAKKAEEKAAKEAENETKKAEKEAAAAKKAEDTAQAADKQAEKQARRQAELQKQREAVERTKAEVVERTKAPVEADAAPAPAPAVSPINHRRCSSPRNVNLRSLS